MLIATAGHVDHGKTALVRALTGVDTDRLPEEKTRGLTIDLGFAYTAFEDGSRLGFVDVPGHERFVRNMLAGVAAIDLVLLVVAADDGPMPQTLEHLAIVSLLGIRRAAIVISKIDTVSAERVTAVAAELVELLAATTLSGAAVFPLSTVTGTGVTELKDHLRAAAKSLPEPDCSGHFRLAIDRSFSVMGAGIVVTGAVFSGQVTSGDQLYLLPDGNKARVRGIHSQGRQATSGRAGERCALNLVGQGLSLASIQRGDWLVATQKPLLSQRIDVRLQLLASEKTALKQGTLLSVHAGSGACSGRVDLLEDKTLKPGASGLAQLVLQRASLLLYGDHFVLRDPAARRTLGGGWVIDPCGPQRGRAQASRIALLQGIDTDDNAIALTILLEAAPSGVDLAQFASSRNLTEAESKALITQVAPFRLAATAGVTVGLSQSRWQTLQSVILAALTRWHSDHPDQVGPKLQTLRQASGSHEKPIVFSAAVEHLIRAAKLVREGLLLRLPQHRPQLTTADEELFKRVLEHLSPAQTKPPALKDLAALLQLDRETLAPSLAQFARCGLLVQLSETRFFHPTAVNQLVQICEQLCQHDPEGQFTVRRFCDIAEIGRNAAIEVLEYFDSIGVTQRLGGQRRLKSP